MWSLATVSSALGGGIILMSLPALVAPALSRRTVGAFPRNEWSAYLLTAAALTWVAWIVLNAPLGRFEPLKPALYVVAPLSFVLIVIFLDELLAPRALGGLFLLLGNPVLTAARWHPSSLRLVVTVWAYLLVIAGIVLVLSPYRFRQAAAFWVKNDARCRLAGGLGVLLGGALLLLGRRVY